MRASTTSTSSLPILLTVLFSLARATPPPADPGPDTGASMSDLAASVKGDLSAAGYEIPKTLDNVGPFPSSIMAPKGGPGAAPTSLIVDTSTESEAPKSHHPGSVIMPPTSGKPPPKSLEVDSSTNDGAHPASYSVPSYTHAKPTTVTHTTKKSHASAPSYAAATLDIPIVISSTRTLGYVTTTLPAALIESVAPQVTTPHKKSKSSSGPASATTLTGNTTGPGGAKGTGSPELSSLSSLVASASSASAAETPKASNAGNAAHGNAQGGAVLGGVIAVLGLLGAL